MRHCSSIVTHTAIVEPQQPMCRHTNLNGRPISARPAHAHNRLLNCARLRIADTFLIPFDWFTFDVKSITRPIVRWTRLVFVALFVFLIGRSISRPIVELKEAMERINKGDLSASPGIDRCDEIGQLAGAISRLQKTLQSGGKMTSAA